MNYVSEIIEDLRAELQKMRGRPTRSPEEMLRHYAQLVLTTGEHTAKQFTEMRNNAMKDEHRSYIVAAVTVQRSPEYLSALATDRGVPWYTQR